MMRKTKKKEFIYAIFGCYTIISIFVMTALKPLFSEEQAHTSPREEAEFENSSVNLLLRTTEHYDLFNN